MEAKTNPEYLGNTLMEAKTNTEHLGNTLMEAKTKPDSCQTRARLVPDISMIEYGLQELRHFIKLMYAINNS